MRRIIQAIAVLLTMMWVGCDATTFSARDRQAADADAARARAEQSQATEAAQKALAARIDEIQHRIDGLKADTRPASVKARRQLDEQIRILQQQVADLRAKLSSTQGRSEEWNKLKAMTEEAIQNINRKLDELTQPKK